MKIQAMAAQPVLSIDKVLCRITTGRSRSSGRISRCSASGNASSGNTDLLPVEWSYRSMAALNSATVSTPSPEWSSGLSSGRNAAGRSAMATRPAPAPPRFIRARAAEPRRAWRHFCFAPPPLPEEPGWDRADPGRFL